MTAMPEELRAVADASGFSPEDLAKTPLELVMALLPVPADGSPAREAYPAVRIRVSMWWAENAPRKP